MTGQILAPYDELVCHVRSHHVEPYHGKIHWDKEQEAKDEHKRGFLIKANELLLIGRDPQLERVKDPEVREELRSLLNDGRSLKTRKLSAPPPPDTHVSSVQVAAWFKKNQLMLASVGTNRVDMQRWGCPRAPLTAWPGEAPGQLSTLWLPLTEGAHGQNLRWRIALAYTGPDHLVAQGIKTGNVTRPARTGSPGAVSLTEKRLNVVVELFKDWLGFPACTYDARTRPVLAHRTEEQNGAHDQGTRFDRLEPVLERLERIGYVGKIRDPDFLRMLVEHGAIQPDDIRGYPELIPKIELLLDLDLLPKA